MWPLPTNPSSKKIYFAWDKTCSIELKTKFQRTSFWENLGENTGIIFLVFEFFFGFFNCFLMLYTYKFVKLYHLKYQSTKKITINSMKRKSNKPILLKSGAKQTKNFLWQYFFGSFREKSLCIFRDREFYLKLFL